MNHNQGVESVTICLVGLRPVPYHAVDAFVTLFWLIVTDDSLLLVKSKTNKQTNKNKPKNKQTKPLAI